MEHPWVAVLRNSFEKPVVLGKAMGEFVTLLDYVFHFHSMDQLSHYGY